MLRLGLLAKLSPSPSLRSTGRAAQSQTVIGTTTELVEWRMLRALGRPVAGCVLTPEKPPDSPGGPARPRVVERGPTRHGVRAPYQAETTSAGGRPRHPR